jgi:hypothetical protein
MGGDKENLDLSDLNASLPAAAAALSAEDRAGLVNALKDKLQSLAGQHTDVLEALSPNVRKRVEYLSRRLTKRTLSLLSNLPLAISEMFAIAALMALGDSLLI